MRDLKVIAEAVTALTERVALLESRLTISDAGIVDASSPQDGDRPAHHVAPSVDTRCPPAVEGAPFPSVGDVCVVNLSMGGLFVGAVLAADSSPMVFVDLGEKAGCILVRRDQVCAAPAAWRRA